MKSSRFRFARAEATGSALRTYFSNESSQRLHARLVSLSSIGKGRADGRTRNEPPSIYLRSYSTPSSSSCHGSRPKRRPIVVPVDPEDALPTVQANEIET